MIYNDVLFVLFFIFLPILFSCLLIKPLKELLFNSAMTCINYQNILIPEGMGLIFFISLLPSALMGFVLYLPNNIVALQFYLATGLTLFGFLDDSLGNSEQKGLKGHYKELFLIKKLTSGVLKSSLLIFYIFITLFFIYNDILLVLLDTVIIAGMANLFNLFDVRPGRAWKLFYFLFLILLLFIKETNLIMLFYPLLVTGLVYLPFELRNNCAMGDTGSNLLGGMIGFFIIASSSLTAKALTIILIIFFHLYCEKKSLTVIISNNPFLNYLDKLGLKRT